MSQNSDSDERQPPWSFDPLALSGGGGGSSETNESNTPNTNTQTIVTNTNTTSTNTNVLSTEIGNTPIQTTIIDLTIDTSIQSTTAGNTSQTTTGVRPLSSRASTLTYRSQSTTVPIQTLYLDMVLPHLEETDPNVLDRAIQEIRQYFDSKVAKFEESLVSQIRTGSTSTLVELTKRRIKKLKHYKN